MLLPSWLQVAVYLGLACIFAWFTIKAFILTFEVIHGMNRTVAVVIDETPDNEGIEYALEFKDSNGTVQLVAYPPLKDVVDCELGDLISIYYSPQRPSQLQINSIRGIWFLPLIGLALTGAFLLCACVYILLLKKSKARTA